MTATILEPTSAETLAAGYRYERNVALHGLVVAKEAINRLRDVARGDGGASADEIAFIINSAIETIDESLALGGYYDDDAQ